MSLGRRRSRALRRRAASWLDWCDGSTSDATSATSPVTSLLDALLSMSIVKGGGRRHVLLGIALLGLARPRVGFPAGTLARPSGGAWAPSVVEYVFLWGAVQSALAVVAGCPSEVDSRAEGAS